MLALGPRGRHLDSVLSSYPMNRGFDTNDWADGIDVVIPVYGAAAALDRCLASVFRHTPQPPHRLIVVIDGPQNRDVEDVLKQHLGGHQIDVDLLRNENRSGFVASVNRGMQHSRRDVVLLNSDTEVTARWLEKLQSTAYSDSSIATVTPLSNNATICSLPEFLEENLLPAGISTDTMGELVERASSREYPRLPTGVGVCLFIRREVLDAVGLFDETRFGLGYGEENEFCARASAAGFVHVADDSTFIFHSGHRSFGTDAARRERRALRLLRSVDAGYIPRVAAFIHADPLRSTRKRVVEEVVQHQELPRTPLTSTRLTVLHVVHGWPPFDVGGTENYARDLAREQTQRHDVAAFTRIAESSRLTGDRVAYLDHGIRVRLVVNNFDRRNPISRNSLRDSRFEKELSRFVDQVNPDLVHVHHLAGHCASLMGVIARHQIPIVYQVQDWWGLCARANLWRADDSLCRGPALARCASCLPMTRLRPRGILNRVLHFARRHYLARQIRMASTYIMGSQTILEWYRLAGAFNPTAPTHVLKYGVSRFDRMEASGHPRRSEASPLVFGFVGALMPHKGAHVAVGAFENVQPNAARLLVWGNPDANPEYAAQIADQAPAGVVEFLGQFKDEEKAAVLGSIDVLIVPSVGLESFGIIAREAMAAGVPVLASRRGALEELEIDDVCGATFEPENSTELSMWIQRIIDDPSILRQWRRALPEPVSIEDHAAAIDRVYDQVLGAS